MLTDLRCALRMLRQQPGFTAAAVATLALGIGANVAVFGIVRALLLRPLPLPAADRIVALTETRSSRNDAQLPVSAHEFVAWQEQSRALDGIALYQPENVTFTGVGEPQTVSTLRVSADYFGLLGLQAARGRVFELPDGGAPEPVAVLSDEFWRRRFGAAPGVIGRTLLLNDQPFTVVGVMGPLPPSLAPDVWLPIDVAAEARAVGRHNLYVLARLASGSTVAQAHAELNAIAARLESELPAMNTDHRVHVRRLREQLVGDFRRALLVLALAVAFVLLITCANVANLLLARTARRQREIMVRLALGASRWRIVRHLLAESLVLAAFGGLAGALIALWTIDAVSTVTAVRIPLLETARLDAHGVVVSALLSVLAGLAAGTAPVLRWLRAPAGALREVGRTTDARGLRIRWALIAAEVALTLMLLVGTGLMVNSFLRLSTVEAGFRTRDVTIAPIDLPATRYPQPHQAQAFVDELTARLAQTPGVAAAGVVSHLPLGGADNWMPLEIVGRPPAAPGQGLTAPFRVATPGYFAALGIPLQRGRIFDRNDVRRALPLVRWYAEQPWPRDYDQPQPAPVALISEAAARQFFADQDPIGQRIRVLFSPEVTIIGIVGDVKHNALNLPAYPHIYLAHGQEPWGSLSLVVRAREDAPIAAAIREHVRALDPALPLALRTMDEVRAASIGRPRFFMLLIGLFAGIALALAVVGIVGVVSCLTAERTREIGVRVALGAQRREILGLILRQGMHPILAGLFAGIIGALALSRFIGTLLYEVAPTDPLTFALVALFLATVAILACLFPARRATRMDPAAALRVE